MNDRKAPGAVAPEMWELLDKSQKDAEKVSRPSLTYFQDAARRLKKNVVAMVSMLIILVIILACVFVPMFWPVKYSTQELAFSNIPPKMEVYSVVEGEYLYVKKDNKAVRVALDGTLIGACNLEEDDQVGRRFVYEVNGQEVIVDYSIYLNAKKAYMALEKKALKDPSIDLAAAQMELNNAPTCELRVDGAVVKPVATLKNKTYIWGTDYLGRDVFIRVVNGGRISLTVGFMAAFINFLIGVTYGGVAGYFGGRLDSVMMRVVDVISSMPTLLYAILFMVVLGNGMVPIIVAITVTGWLAMARIVRGQVLTLKNQEFVLAAQSLGASTKRIMVKHLIPNSMGPIMVSMTMMVPSAIFTEAFLSFVGLGISAPMASWGSLCNDALQGLFTYPYQLFYPALALSITILAFNLFSDGLRDALDPKQRK